MSAASFVSRAVLFTFAVIGVAGAAPIAWQQFTGVKACPAIVTVPACNVVLLGYVLMAISAFLMSRARTITFFTAWAPLFLLALIGSGLELVSQDTCPRTSGGVPMCFLSLGLLTLLVLIFLSISRINTLFHETPVY